MSPSDSRRTNVPVPMTLFFEHKDTKKRRCSFGYKDNKRLEKSPQRLAQPLGAWRLARDLPRKLSEVQKLPQVGAEPAGVMAEPVRERAESPKAHSPGQLPGFVM